MKRVTGEHAQLAVDMFKGHDSELLRQPGLTPKEITRERNIDAAKLAQAIADSDPNAENR